MKLSINFVKDYIEIDENMDVKKIAEDMTRVGNEYDSAQKLINATKLIVGEVKKCEMHPDSDHLHVCKVDIGNEILNIVCGAPNVRKGLKVVVAQVGAELPGDFKIKKGTIRGVDSEGMLCSKAELGIESKFLTEEDKNGIYELQQDAKVGEDPIKYMGLDDNVIDFELTANRGDLLSILGMAYELGAIYDRPVKEIELEHSENKEDINNTFKIEINTDNCSIFLVKKVENIEIKESPDFIKNRLIASGIRPINNIVDISNYVMIETGQPLHFYDADTLKDKLEVRMAQDGEKLTTLDGNERILSLEDIVISDGNKSIGLAGVMGGLETEITSNTKNVIIESAIFDPVKVRRTSNKILRSEASLRFEKGLDSNRTYMAIERACNLLEKYAGATIVGGMVKYDKTEKSEKEIEIKFENVNRILGTNINQEDILDVFRKLKFTYKVDGDIVKVFVPRRRLDINIKEDLIEEVGRIYGVDNIQGKLPILPIKPGKYNKTIRQLRNKVIELGLNETLSYVLVNEKESKMFTKKDKESIKLLEPITKDRSTLRQSILSSLYKIYEDNVSRNNKDVSIFEIAKTFSKEMKDDNEIYIEENKLACLMTGEYYLGIGNKKNVDFFIIKGIAEEILEFLGYAGRYSFILDKNLPEELHPGQSAAISVNNDIVGIIGRVHPSLCRENVYVLEINLDKLATKKVGKMKYKEISKYPSIKKDLAIIVDKNITSEEVALVIKKAGGKLLKKIEVFDVYTGENIGKDKKSLAYSLSFEATDRTLTDEEINIIIDKVVANVEKSLRAELRK